MTKAMETIEAEMFNTLAIYEDHTNEALKYLDDMCEMLKEKYEGVNVFIGMASGPSIGKAKDTFNLKKLGFSNGDADEIKLSIGVNTSKNIVRVNMTTDIDYPLLDRMTSVLSQDTSRGPYECSMDEEPVTVFEFPIAKYKKMIDLTCYHYLDYQGLIPQHKKRHDYSNQVVTTPKSEEVEDIITENITISSKVKNALENLVPLAQSNNVPVETKEDEQGTHYCFDQGSDKAYKFIFNEIFGNLQAILSIGATHSNKSLEGFVTTCRDLGLLPRFNQEKTQVELNVRIDNFEHVLGRLETIYRKKPQIDVKLYNQNKM